MNALGQFDRFGGLWCWQKPGNNRLISPNLFLKVQTIMPNEHASFVDVTMLLGQDKFNIPPGTLYFHYGDERIFC